MVALSSFIVRVKMDESKRPLVKRWTSRAADPASSSSAAQPASRSAAQPAVQPETNDYSVQIELKEEVLETLMEHMNAIMVLAHKATSEPRAPLDKKRKLEMREKAFGTTLNSLERTYTKLLHETVDNEWADSIAAKVRDLGDSMKWKLRNHCADSAEEACELLEEVMQHWQTEFKWAKIISILEEAIDVAWQEKQCL